MVKRKGEEETSNDDELGGHWGNLYRIARTGLRQILLERGSIQTLLSRHMNELPRIYGKEDTEVMIHYIARFLDQTQRAAEVKDAAAYLARSSWHVRTAIEKWTAPEHYNDEAELADDEKPADSEEVGQAKAAGVVPGADTDPELDTDTNSAEADTPEMKERRRLNPDIDRSPAIKGRIEPGKFVIVMNEPYGKGQKKPEFPKCKKGKDLEGKDFDWDNPDDIRALNRWRSQVLRRSLGNTRAARAHFHPDEIEWLIERHREHQQLALAQGVEPKFNHMKWPKITEAFNRHFEGRILPGCTTPRPSRSRSSLATERYRIPAICKLADLNPKSGTSIIGRARAASTRIEVANAKREVTRDAAGRYIGGGNTATSSDAASRTTAYIHTTTSITTAPDHLTAPDTTPNPSKTKTPPSHPEKFPHTKRKKAFKETE